MSELWDEFCRQGSVDTAKVNFNLACAVYEWDNVSTQDITDSFRITGIFPFDRNLPMRFKTEKELAAESAEMSLQRVKNNSIASRQVSVQRRQADKETL